MSKIPTGNVTFLFTDIEGSTRLAQEFPDTLHLALAKHNSIIKEAIESNKGFIFKIVGDSFCCAFENAGDAVNASVKAQLNLANEKWEKAIIKVRIGIHQGKAEWNSETYTGYITLARTERVMSASYGGQILISNDAYQLTKENMAEKVSFRDLGERRLKDVIQPIRLFQIVSQGIQEDFPPLKTIDARPNNLPIQFTNFIGREKEIKKVKDLLKQTRLLTIIGSGGAGKTRLTLQVAADVIDDFAHGVWFVDLASLAEPVLLSQAIMTIFKLKEEPNRSLEYILCDYLKEKEVLIILDNCEHLIDQCAGLAEKLLGTSPKLKIIATTREALRCSGEQIHKVLPLNTPAPNEKLLSKKLCEYEAVRLFIERAIAVNENFRVNNQNAPALAQICYQLDGIPLAIELAAARIKILSIEKICERLNDRFSLLTGGKRTALPRQQTLRALIDWSYDLLTAEEKTLWKRLSVFTGGWTLEAAEEVCSANKIKKGKILELLNQLTEKSIIIFEIEKERYRILESLKQYGEEKLKVMNEEENLLSKHLIYYNEFAEKAASQLTGRDMKVWLERLEEDHGNLQSAVEWAIKNKEREKGARLAAALGSFWEIRGHYSTGRRLLNGILDNHQGVSKSVLRKILFCNGMLSMLLGQYESAEKFFEESLSINRELEDEGGIADTLNNLGNIAYFLGNFGHAEKYYEETMEFYQRMQNKRGIAITVSNLGVVAYRLGNYGRAQKFYEKSLSLHRELGNKPGIAASLANLGDIWLHLENYDHARRFIEEALLLNRDMGNKHGIAGSLITMGKMEFKRANYEHAYNFYEESLSLSREIGDKRGIANSLSNLGNVAYCQKNYERSRKFYEESLLLKREIGDKRSIARTLKSLSNMAKDNGDNEQAEKYYEESIFFERETGHEEKISG